MRHRLLDLLVCPECGGTLALQEYATSKDGNTVEVLEGLLTCGECARTYPVIGGIPRMLPDDLQHSLLQYHRNFFERYPHLSPTFGSGDKSPFTGGKRATYQSFSYQRIEMEPPDLRYANDWIVHFRRRIAPRQGNELAGKLGIDAGCGFGRHLYAASSFGAEVIGIDLSEGVQRAYRNNYGNPNVHVVQGDIYRMPFRPGTFDFGYSFGVLHHLPDPRRGFDSLARMVREGGTVMVWVYGYEGMSFLYRLSHMRTLRRLTTRLPRTWQRAMCWVLAVVLELTLWMPYRVLSRFRLTRPLADRLPAHTNAYQPLALKATAIFDRLGTPITHFHNREELQKWFADAGMENWSVFTPDRRGWQAGGRRTTSTLELAKGA